VPICVRAREIYRSGALGEIKAVVYRWHNPRPAAMPLTWRDDPTLSSAGTIADCGSHAYDLLRWILGQDVNRVAAHAQVLTPAKADVGNVNLGEALDWGRAHRLDQASTRKGDVLDYATLVFQWRSGAVGALILSHAPYLRKGLAPEIELHGVEASLGVDRVRHTLTWARPDQMPEVLETIEDPGFGNRFAKHVFPALRAQIAGEPSEHPDLEDGLAAQLFTDAALLSSKEGRWVDVADSSFAS
jgi:predicted dehydrogenase